MAHPSNPKSIKPRNRAGDSKPNRLWWIALPGILLVIALGIYFSKPNTSSAVGTPSAKTEPKKETQQADVPDIQKLKGRWLRPDGGYVLEILQANENGSLVAGYFNPKPINVSKAEWVRKDNKLFVLVELNDVNYPGSTYGLEYKEKEDRLSGTYYQAVEKSTFEVEFLHEK